MLDLADIKARYNAKSHPKVKSGEMTEEQALTEVNTIHMLILI